MGTRKLKILYPTVLTEGESAMQRMWALERAGHEVVPFQAQDYYPSNSLFRKLAFRVATGPWVGHLNRDLLKVAERERPDIVWADKLLWMQPSTLDRLRKMGVPSVSYMIDNPFGPRRDPGWRLYMKTIPHYDLHVTQRDVSVREYQRRGARDVMKVQTAYEPTIHFPPPAGWGDANRDREVSFIGTPYDQRADFLTRLWRNHGLPVVISGNERLWKKALDPEAFAALYREGELYATAYREGIWRSKINLSFITHANQDEYTHKSFEIAGCGGFLLAERSEGHQDRFIEDKEAVFFSTLEECVQKIQRWLPDAAGREKIAAAGHIRGEQGGYHNDGQMALIVERIQRRLLAERS